MTSIAGPGRTIIAIPAMVIVPPTSATAMRLAKGDRHGRAPFMSELD
jgi:hypothetical protein